VPEQIKITPATVDDVTHFYGSLPPHRSRAYVGKLGDKRLGLGGIYFLSDGTRVGFLILDEEGYKYPRALYKAAFQFLEMMQQEGVPSIRAVADPTIPKAGRFLKNLGFETIEIYDTQVIYIWRATAQ
jgi:hypothetical protein